MSTTLIDLSREHAQSSDDLPGLHAHLAQLIGEPFRFVQYSYGDELTLHFGDLEPARHPKLKGRLYGAFMLGLRASPWNLKSGSEPWVVNGGMLLDASKAELGTPLDKRELESRKIIEPGSLVLAAVPFFVQPVDGFGLQLRFADGSLLSVVPAVPVPDEPEDEGLPDLADWEVFTPRGLLSAGPGRRWSFEPKGVASTAQKA